MRESRVPAQASIYNLITTIMLILTLAVCLGVAYLAMNPLPGGQQVGAQPTIFALTTQTPTLVGPTLNATWTATSTGTVSPTPTASRTPTTAPTDLPTLTATATIPPTATRTPTLTATASLTPTINTTLTTLTPTLTLTATLTRTPTRTPTPGTPSPTFTPSLTPTNAPVSYRLKSGPTYTANLNGQSCANWRGVGGQVFNKSDQPVTGVRLRVTHSNGVDTFTVTSGSATVYGTGGYEQQTLLLGTWSIVVIDANGSPISPSVSFEPQADCSLNQSLALINFIQN
jgi:hypothetical protein